MNKKAFLSLFFINSTQFHTHLKSLSILPFQTQKLCSRFNIWTVFICTVLH